MQHGVNARKGRLNRLHTLGDIGREMGDSGDGAAAQAAEIVFGSEAFDGQTSDQTTGTGDKNLEALHAVIGNVSLGMASTTGGGATFTPRGYGGTLMARFCRTPFVFASSARRPGRRNVFVHSVFQLHEASHVDDAQCVLIDNTLAPARSRALSHHAAFTPGFG